MRRSEFAKQQRQALRDAEFLRTESDPKHQRVSNKMLLESERYLADVAADLEERLEEAEAKCQELGTVVDIQTHDIAALHADHAYRAGAIGRAEAENYSLKLALHQAEQRHIMQSQELQKTQQELAKARS